MTAGMPCTSRGAGSRIVSKHAQLAGCYRGQATQATGPRCLAGGPAHLGWGGGALDTVGRGAAVQAGSAAVAGDSGGWGSCWLRHKGGHWLGRRDELLAQQLGAAGQERSGPRLSATADSRGWGTKPRAGRHLTGPTLPLQPSPSHQHQIMPADAPNSTCFAATRCPSPILLLHIHQQVAAQPARGAAAARQLQVRKAAGRGWNGM